MAARRAAIPLLRSSASTLTRAAPSARNPLLHAARSTPRLSSLPSLAIPTAATATTTPLRWSSSSATPPEPTIYTFEGVRALSERPDPTRIIIDVREPSELDESGRIPTAENMPIKSAPTGIFLPPDEFEDAFGFEKPGPDTELVFYCKAGVRGMAAARLALQSGYQKVGSYEGSWLEWAAKGGKVER